MSHGNSRRKERTQDQGNALGCIKVRRVQNQKSGWRPKKSKDDKKGEPTKKHIIGPKPQDGVIKEVIVITTHQRGESREAEQLCN
ncbi:hypothetical protein F2Q68_00008695 [Brassica cretica]|uniref:Uncharacterized protein n=1 Tax=Brassica cretica TaxID=69181 RepID=A0A8S9KRF1_BRACR|nr:hypothetical protein F2Q68_00008695 [Brassica cretica]